MLEVGSGAHSKPWRAEAGPWEQTKSRSSLTLPSQRQSSALPGMGALKCVSGPHGMKAPGT